MDNQELYLQVYTDVLKRQNQTVAHLVALEAVRLAEEAQKHVVNSTKVEESTIDTNDVFVKFSLQPAMNETITEELVVHSVGNELVFEGVLDDVMTNVKGKHWTPEALQSFADQINKHGLKGDFIDDEAGHAQVRQIYKEFGHLAHEQVAKAVREKRSGIVKVMKAIYKDGRLWIRGVVDKRYKNFLDKFRHASIEAIVPKECQHGDEFTGGYAVGLQLLDVADAANPRSFINPVSA